MNKMSKNDKYVWIVIVIAIVAIMPLLVDLIISSSRLARNIFIAVIIIVTIILLFDLKSDQK